MAPTGQHVVFRALVCIAISAVLVSGARPLGDLDASLQAATAPFTGEVWALLIAGSQGYGNYRHQADVAHAYQVLHNGGVPDDHIVVMVYDDIAYDFQNPHQGQLFNKPGGPDVYKGLPKDYTGENVNAATFLTVLAGKEDVPTVLGSSGKTIKSKANDRVFVYFSDHGAPGILGMPSGEFLYADKFTSTLHEKAQSNGFAEMVIYIEACESGSIFQGTLDDSLKIYAVTAANAVESSWGAYCPGQNPGPPPEFGTCLGDLFSVSFLEDDDSEDLVKETLAKQFELVKRRTSQNGTYDQGSHALQFGSLIIDTEPVGDYVGEAGTDLVAKRSALPPPARMGAVPQREADLLPLRWAVEHAQGDAARAAAHAALDAALQSRAAVDAGVRGAVAGLLREPRVAALFQANHGVPLATAAAAAGTSPVEFLVAGVPPRPAGAALVNDWECLRGMVSAWEAECGKLDQYGMKHTRAFSNLCNASIAPSGLRAQAAQSCRKDAATVAAS